MKSNERLHTGVVGTGGQNHAVVRRRLSNRALCGAGRIVLVLPGGFDPDDRLACAECKKLVSQGTNGD